MAEIDSPLSVTKARLRNGTWEGIVHGSADEAPNITVTHLEQPVPDISLTEADAEGQWRLCVPVPSQLLSDGVQTFLILDANTGTRLASFAIAAGSPLSEDLRAEVDLLRAELDMLKRAFRRHCVETAS